ncbi:unnamed protein product [Penicillium pancosmium]
MVPVALPRHGPLTKTAIKDIVQMFATNNFRIADPETLTVKRLAGENQNYAIERPMTEDDVELGPSKVILKLHSEHDKIIEVFKDLVPSKLEEAQICHDYGQSGLGAKVYGFFQTKDGTFGRVDEFLDARNLAPEDVEDESIRADVARGKTQLEENPVQSYYDVITREFKRYHKMDKLKKLFYEGGIRMDDLIDYDFASKIRRVTDKLESIEGKKGWCIHDAAFMNVMVKNSPKKGESKIVLIDFEFVFRNYRAFDIGEHFMQKVFNWVDEDGKMASRRPYTEEEKKHFCEKYVEQWNRETGDLDTGEQVFRESELGYLLAITWDIHNMLCYVEQDDSKELLSHLDLLAFSKLFEDFVIQYKKLGLDTQ